MKLKFDSNQEYQLDAVNAITDIFKGQPLNKGDFEFEFKNPDDRLQFGGQLLVGNNLVLSDNTLLKNLNTIQENNKLDKSAELDGLNFSVEMETGTGKTYVYLRTMHELYKKYGFKKFIIVVPSIAIKEGVMKNLEITNEHFNTLYENPEMDYYVYDPKKRGLLKNFATTNTLQVLVINIDSFAKFSEQKSGKNVIYQDSDWGVPIEFIQNVKPIVIVDEPQNMETEIRKKAIENLNPLCTLRYSATHKNHYNLVYKLDPVRAYDLGLVKKIEVDSIVSSEDFNSANVELKSVQAKKNNISAKIKIDVQDKNDIKKKEITVGVGDDLFILSGEREIYKTGFVVDELSMADQSISFTNGEVIYVGEQQGGLNDDIVKYQIRKTIENHFEKELQLKDKGIKVLSLFFIDKVANYREYKNNNPVKGRYAEWFEEVYLEILKNPRFKELKNGDVAQVHNGYFSQDKKGVLKDTRGDTQADIDTYSLIMKDKEKLLSIDEPLKFIFSHSALREGWDNPNVFQICTINETRSEMKKRQEIGRGLRLPVNQDGERVQDENLNILTVIANESYEDFAKALQTEIEEECGVEFGNRVKDKNKRKDLKLKKGYKLDENFKLLWDKIKHKTRYSVEYETNDLINKASELVKEVNIRAPEIVNIRARLNLTEKGVDSATRDIKSKMMTTEIKNIPDILGYIQSKTKLTKDTILKIIKKSDKVKDIFKNPQQFMDKVSQEIIKVMNQLMIDGIKYEKIAGDYWEMTEFENEELSGYLNNLFKVNNQDKTLYNYVVCDSDVEKNFAEGLENLDSVKFYFKLPYWFKIETPIGSYNPDWAVVFENDKKIYFVAETKSQGQELRESENIKIKCGKKHFEQLSDVDFKAPISSVDELII